MLPFLKGTTASSMLPFLKGTTASSMLPFLKGTVRKEKIIILYIRRNTCYTV
jgi:hypothetical protein